MESVYTQNESSSNITRYVGLGLSALLAIGSFGAWVTFGPLSVSGLKGDGKITLVAAVVAAFGFLFSERGTLDEKRTSITALVFALLSGIAALLTSGYDLNRINNVHNSDNIFAAAVQPGWGLYLTVLASLGIIVAAIVAMRKN